MGGEMNPHTWAAEKPDLEPTMVRSLGCEACDGRGFFPNGVCQNTQNPHKTKKACEAAGCEWVEIGEQVSKKLICRMSGYVRNQCQLDKESNCTKCGKTVAPEQADADQCSECGNEGEGWKECRFPEKVHVCFTKSGKTFPRKREAIRRQGE